MCLATAVIKKKQDAASSSMQSDGLTLLDIVVGQSAAIFKLLASEDETLLVRRDALLVLNFALHVVNAIT